MNAGGLCPRAAEREPVTVGGCEGTWNEIHREPGGVSGRRVPAPFSAASRRSSKALGVSGRRSSRPESPQPPPTTIRYRTTRCTPSSSRVTPHTWSPSKTGLGRGANPSGGTTTPR